MTTGFSHSKTCLDLALSSVAPSAIINPSRDVPTPKKFHNDACNIACSWPRYTALWELQAPGNSVYRFI